MDLASIRLTETVTKGGCAAKLPAGQLRKFLEDLKIPKPKDLHVGTDTLDDACLWDLGNGQYLINTLDFFTPIVDDAYDFGQIAAANALSDVYAMGGAPKIALTILGFPASKLPLELVGPLMAGALAKITEAGACLAGGHSIDDDTLKLGFSVTGFVDKAKAWTNSKAQPGDALILTKALGTGTITSALKQRKAEDAWIHAATQSMTTLNNAVDLLQGTSIHAATDITGFGLAGHARQLAEASKVALNFDVASLPTLPGAIELLADNVLNRAHRTNADYVREAARYIDVSEPARWLTVDPQTSGGLLLVVPKGDADRAVKALRTRFPATKIIGSVAEQRPGAAEPVVVFR